MLCKNGKCRAVLGLTYWGSGYCSRWCLSQDDSFDPESDRPLLDPTDPTGQAEICRNRDEIEAMQQAYEVDERLPRIIYLRRKGKTLRQIGAECGLDAATCNRILARATPNLLRACGLRKI